MVEGRAADEPPHARRSHLEDWTTPRPCRASLALSRILSHIAKRLGGEERPPSLAGEAFRDPVGHSAFLPQQAMPVPPPTACAARGPFPSTLAE